MTSAGGGVSTAGQMETSGDRTVWTENCGFVVHVENFLCFAISKFPGSNEAWMPLGSRQGLSFEGGRYLWKRVAARIAVEKKKA